MLVVLAAWPAAGRCEKPPAASAAGSVAPASQQESPALTALTPASEAAYAYARGLAAYEARRLEEAIEWWRRTVRLDPAMAQAHVGLGAALLQHGESATAEAEFRAALELNPHHADAWANWGAIAVQRGEYRQAVERFRKAVGCEPTDASLWVDLAISYAGAGDLPQARTAALNALSFDPESAEAKTLVERLDRQLMADPGQAVAAEVRP